MSDIINYNQILASTVSKNEKN